MRKSIVLALIALLAGFQLMNAMPARPGAFTVTQPDGTKLVVRLHGDEFGHWMTDVQGHVIRQEEDGFFRRVSDLEAAQLRRGAPARRTAAQETRAARAQQHIAFGEKHFFVVLVEFQDKAYSVQDPQAAFTALLNEPGYSVNNGTGSARDFYYENSHGRFTPVFDVYGPVKLSQKMSYYGGNSGGSDKAAEEAVIEACQALDEEVDFSQYDNDGDGEVDLVFMYYAGYNEAEGGSANTIWPHQWELSSAGKSLTLDETKIDSYACTSELTGNWGKTMCGIGTASHEFAHAMGLPDFYDIDGGTNGYAGGLFSFSLMDSGGYNNNGRTPPYFNFVERVMLGWLTDDDYLEFPETGDYTLTTVQDDVAYRTATDMDGEYFVYECRGSNGWDSSLPAHGLLVYHVDKSDRSVRISSGNVKASRLWSQWKWYNAINENGSHPCFYIVPSADQENLAYGSFSYGDNYYFDDSYAPKIPFPGSEGVTEYSPVSWNGKQGLVSFSQIAYSQDVVQLHATVSTGELDFVTIENPGSYRAGGRFTFKLVRPEAVEAPASIVWYYDDEPAGAASVTLTRGAHVIDAYLTYADGRKETLTLEIQVK